MSVMKYKDASGNWQAVDALINGEFKYTTVEPLDRQATNKIGYDLSSWVGAGANFMLFFTCDLNSAATSGDWDIHVIHYFDGEFSGLRKFTDSNANSDLSLENETVFSTNSTFNIDFNQETRVLELTSDKYGSGIAFGDKAYNAVLFYCG